MITKDLLDSVASRAAVLARRYYFLEKEDLMQEGYIFLMELDKKPLSDKQKHKAINYMFTDLERHALRQQKIEKNMSSFPVEPDMPADSDTPEEVVEREQITNQLMATLSRQELLVLEGMIEGKAMDDIAAFLGIKRDTVRRIATKIIKKRKEIEND